MNHASSAEISVISVIAAGRPHAMRECSSNSCRLLADISLDRPSFRHTKPFKDVRHWTEFGETELKEVESNKCSEKKPVFGVIQGACFNPECKAGKYKQSG